MLPEIEKLSVPPPRIKTCEIGQGDSKIIEVSDMFTYVKPTSDRPYVSTVLPSRIHPAAKCRFSTIQYFSDKAEFNIYWPPILRNMDAKSKLVPNWRASNNMTITSYINSKRRLLTEQRSRKKLKLHMSSEQTEHEVSYPNTVASGCWNSY